jgi:hypothetical protein
VASVTVTQAAKLTGVTRKTLYAHINKGKLSKAAGGLIDTSELLRVYGAFVEEVTPRVSPKETPSNTMVTLSQEQLETIIKQAVKSALLEAIPLLIEHKKAAPEYEPRLKTEEEMKDLDYLSIPTFGKGKY